MSKRNSPARVKLSDFKNRRAEEGAIDVELDDGSNFRIPPPELWPEEFSKRMANDESFLRSPEAQARAIVGDDEYERFIAGGGTSMLFHALVQAEHEVPTGESLPSSDS